MGFSLLTANAVSDEVLSFFSYLITAPNDVFSFPAIVPTSAVISAPNQHKGPVVTKYAVPPHVLAQMKARGVNGTTAAIPSAPLLQPQSPHVAQHLGWQQWPGYGYPQGVNNYTQAQPQAMIYPGNQNTSLLTPPASATFQVPPWTARPQYETLPAPTETSTSRNESIQVTDMTLQTAIQDVEREESSPDEDDQEDDLDLLDVPDYPKSWGTSEYNKPKLVAKPVYSIAPEWTSSGFGEVTLSGNPEGRTESDYIKLDDLDSNITTIRTLVQDMDPIFAIIDLDAPATASNLRSGSKDSGKSELETPYSCGSGDTRPTSVDGHDNYPQMVDGGHSRSISPFQRPSHEDIQTTPKQQHNPKRKKQRDRRWRNRDWKDEARPQDRKRKRNGAEDQIGSPSESNGPLEKKHQPSTMLTTDLESGKSPTDVDL